VQKTAYREVDKVCGQEGTRVSRLVIILLLPFYLP